MSELCFNSLLNPYFSIPNSEFIQVLRLSNCFDPGQTLVFSFSVPCPRSGVDSPQYVLGVFVKKSFTLDPFLASLVDKIIIGPFNGNYMAEKSPRGRGGSM